MKRLIRKAAASKEDLLKAIENNKDCSYEENGYCYLCPYDGFSYELGEVSWFESIPDPYDPYSPKEGHYDFGTINIGADMEFFIEDNSIKAFLYHDGHTFESTLTYDEMIDILKTNTLPEYSEELREYLEENTEVEEPEEDPDRDWENRFDN